jgi:hypothetical protein
VSVMASQGMTNTQRQLQKECSRALRYYVRVIQEGCDLLSGVKEGFITEHNREEIFSHRKEELLAYAAYTRARKRLWSFLSYSDPPMARMNGMPTRSRRASF